MVMVNMVGSVTTARLLATAEDVCCETARPLLPLTD
jgi:hypothetical protein